MNQAHRMLYWQTGCRPTRTEANTPAPHQVRHDSESHIGMHGWYRCVMSTQIAVRLPDEMVAFLDHAVAQGKAASRAELVSAALEREMRRQAAGNRRQAPLHVGIVLNQMC